MELEIKPLSNITDHVSERGIMILENVQRLPVYGIPFASSFMLFVINKSGSIDLDYDGRKVHYGKHELYVIYPNHILTIKGSSEDFCSTFIILSTRVYEKLVKINMHINRFKFEQNPGFLLDDEQYNGVMKLVDAMSVVDAMNINIREDMLLSFMDIFTVAISNYREGNLGNRQETIQSTLSTRFYDALIKYIDRHREVSFYADLFCLTPKYFSTVIKQETGKTAGHWIRNYAIMKAKMLIRTEPGISMQQICVRLNFQDQTIFSRLFKKETGMTPTEYKKRF